MAIAARWTGESVDRLGGGRPSEAVDHWTVTRSTLLCNICWVAEVEAIANDPTDGGRRDS